MAVLRMTGIGYFVIPGVDAAAWRRGGAQDDRWATGFKLAFRTMRAGIASYDSPTPLSHGVRNSKFIIQNS